MAKEKDNIKKQNENGLDQFFTKPKEAKRLFDLVCEKIDVNQFDLFVEPSVGANSFGCLFPKSKSLLMDIEPQENIFVVDESGKTIRANAKEAKVKIIQMDFLSLGAVLKPLGLMTNKKVIAIGNPPFGKNSSLATKFFNICAKFCDTICFIIPRTFKRVSVQNQLDLNFHLIYNEDLPFSNKDCVFEPAMNAKCSFQIWQRKSEKRKKTKLPKTHPDWTFLAMGPLEDREGCENKQPTPPKDASFAMKAYGSNCGEIVTEDLDTLRPKSWHWIKCDDPEKLINKFKQLDYSISKDTVRQESIGRAELVQLYSEKFDKKLDK